MQTFIPQTAVLFSVAILALSPATQAQTLLNVKIGITANDYSGGSGPESNGAYTESPAGVLGLANSTWNEYAYKNTTPSGVSVVDSTGAAISGVTLTVGHSGGTGTLTTSGNPSFLMDNMPYQNAGGIFTISLAGLLANTQYEFIGYASNPGSSAGSTWAVTTGTAGSGVFSTDGTSADITTGAGKAYAGFYVTTDGSGSLAVTDTGLSGIRTILQGFQLQVAPVPEPASIALLGLGFAGLLGFRRRQKS